MACPTPSSSPSAPPLVPASDALLEGVFSSAGVGLCLLDPDGRVCKANGRWLESVQLDREEVLGRDIWEIFPQSPPELRVLHARARAGEVIDVPVHRQVLAGREIWYAGRVSPVPFPTGTGVLITAWDVTAAKRAELSLREEHAKLRRQVASTPLALVEWDGDYRVTGYSRRAEELFGFPPEEVLGRRIDEIPWVPEEDWPSVRAVMHDMFTAERPTNVNANQNRRQGGEVIHCEWYNSALHDASGKLVSILSLVLDVTDRKRAEAALRDANERLRDVDRRKDEFLAMLSHELRNPLAPIRNAVTILGHAQGTPEQAARARAVIARQVDHLARLVDDLLDVTRVARGKIALRREPLDLVAVLHRVAEDHRALLTERGLSLSVAAPATPIAVEGDATRLAQVLGNLLQNAVKFTERGGRVSVSLAAREAAAEVRVADTGVGIARDLLGRVFEPFVQEERSLARTRGGLGLGLALVKALVELHGGTVRAESAGPGEGAELIVRLPLAR